MWSLGRPGTAAVDGRGRTASPTRTLARSSAWRRRRTGCSRPRLPRRASVLRQRRGVDRTALDEGPSEWTRVIDAAELAEGRPTLAGVGDVPLVLVRRDGTWPTRAHIGAGPSMSVSSMSSSAPGAAAPCLCQMARWCDDTSPPKAGPCSICPLQAPAAGGVPSPPPRAAARQPSYETASSRYACTSPWRSGLVLLRHCPAVASCSPRTGDARVRPATVL